MVGIIPAAGLGTRLMKTAKGTPKELLPVMGKPMIKWCVEELRQSEISEIVIVISPAKEEIKEYLCMGGVAQSIQFVYQDKPIGLADAIYRCKDLVGDSEFAVSLPDNIFIGKPPPIAVLIPVAKRYKKSVIALMRVSSADAQYFGNCGGGVFKPLNSTEYVFETTELWDKKPGYFSTDGKPWVLRYFSRYVLQPSVFEYIDKVRTELHCPYNREFDDVPVLQDMVKSRELLGALVDGKVFDVGNPRGYKFANELLITHRRCHSDAKPKNLVDH